MGQFFTDDIEALLKSGHGDYGRLSRIKADFETKKLVTLEDRKYVDGLIARYIQPPTQTQRQEKVVKTPEKRIVPPPPPTNVVETGPPSATMEKPIEKTRSKRNLKNVVIGVAAIVFAVLVISIVAMNQDNVGLVVPSTKALEVDQDSYVKGDIISVSGSADSTVAKLAINDPDGQEVWTEAAKVKADGKFSTLVIAGGSGWEKAGKYTVTSSAGDKVEKITFDFNPNELP